MVWQLEKRKYPSIHVFTLSYVHLNAHFLNGNVQCNTVLSFPAQPLSDHPLLGMRMDNNYLGFENGYILHSTMI